MGGKGIRTSETKCSFHPFTIALKTQYRRQSTSVSSGSSFSLLLLLSLWLLLLQPNCQTITGASKRKDEKKGKKNKETRKGNRSQGPAKISSHSSRIACPRCNTGIKRRGQRRKTVRRQQRPRENMNWCQAEGKTNSGKHCLIATAAEYSSRASLETEENKKTM